MADNEKRLRLIKYLLNENPRYSEIEIPVSDEEQMRLYRSLVNIRMPEEISEEYLKTEDEFLSSLLEEKGVVSLSDLTEVSNGIYIWQGDITTLRVDAIVNAANSGMLGCFVPCHACIDNCIHTFSGVRLRMECDRLMKKQGFEEPTGKAKITPAYNLPCKYVIHTVGPIVTGFLTKKHEQLLSDCYRSCLEKAEENGLESIAFCCISTGEFHFPNERAAEIAVETVMNYKKSTGSKIKVIFNVFKDKDRLIYERILGKN
ncbi:MAG: protein-ADP-ribose hydrolase [Ruminococcaceae bacterium]|nr:protein-ADP-ribose hydrolase [Oscillospiraceae bacterium]